MFKKVYKECYPFSMECLYDIYKQDLFMKLLRNRKGLLIDLAMRVSKENRKIREYWFEQIINENKLIDEIYGYIQNNDYNKINYSYCNWLISENKIILLSDLVSRYHVWRG